MKNFFETYIREAGQQEKLSSQERDRMRSVMTEYARMKPIRKPVASPYGFSSIAMLLMRPAAGLMMASLVLVLGFGTATYAAEGALPGDILYPVKVSIVEPARILLAPTAEARAEVRMKLAERRIDEAATLAKEGRLTTDTEAHLAARFATNLELADQEAGETEETRPSTADAAKVAFTARLETYESVLAHVDREKGGTSTENFRKTIRDRLAVAESAPAPQADARAMMFMAAMTKEAAEPSRSPEEVERLRVRAETELKTSSQLLAANAEKLGKSASVTARKEFARASKRFERGIELLREENLDAAYRAFEESLSAAARLTVLMHTATSLGINAFETENDAAATSSSSVEEKSKQDEEAENETEDGTPKTEDGILESVLPLP